MKKAVIEKPVIDSLIYEIRDHKVMLDADLAELYGVETKNLNKAVKRNIARFPDDFMFQLSTQEAENLRCQFGTSSADSSAHGGRRYSPYVFTEQGVAMLSSVINSPQAIQVNIEIMRAFVRIKKMLVSHTGLARKVDAMEKKYDKQFKGVFDALRRLIGSSSGPKQIKGFSKFK
ncbi:ORF6N domain-containing protein [Verrucomicrobiota bacterium]